MSTDTWPLRAPLLDDSLVDALRWAIANTRHDVDGDFLVDDVDWSPLVFPPPMDWRDLLDGEEER